MFRLPPHHVPRPRLTQLCADERVVVVEAAGGYGKSVLGAELVDYWGTVGIGVSLDHDEVTAPVLAARLHDAVQRAGFTDAATASASRSDPVGMLEALLDALGSESCAFVIDDAHNAAVDAAELIESLASRVTAQQRLVVLARQLPPGALRLRRAEFCHLSAADLAMASDETLQLCRSFQLEVTPEGAAALGRATGGWTAATVLAAARAARTGETPTEAAGGADHSSGAVAAILDEALAALGQARLPVLAQLARLPLLDPGLVDSLAEEEGFFQVALAAGIPFTPSRSPWWEIPGSVRDVLATFAPPSREAMRAAALEYRRRGELGPAVDLLIASADADAAAAMLAETPPDVEENLDYLELLARFEQLPAASVDLHPGALVLVGRRLGYASLWALCCKLLDRAVEVADDPRLLRAAEAELIKVRFLADLEYGEAIERARAILEETGPDEELTRARASEFLGYALCHIVDSTGSRHAEDLAEAEEAFTRASALYKKLGMRSAASFIGVDWSVHIEFRLGRLDAAMERIQEALLLAADRPRAVGFLNVWPALFAAEQGQGDLCRRSAEEVFRAAKRIKSPMLVGQGHWKLAILSSYEGDADTMLSHLHQVEATRGNWWKLEGASFLAEAADMCSRVGLVELAREYLDRAKADPQDAGHLIALSDAAVSARHGDPDEAEAKLESLIGPSLDPRERWRVQLLIAYVAFRRGDSARAEALAAKAHEEAARIGQPNAPLIRERVITEQLAALADRSGPPSTLTLQADSLPMSLYVLGRFELTVAGRPVKLGTGKEIALLKYVAARGGRAHSEEAIEALWPGADPQDGLNRLRTVLHRLGRVAGKVIERSGKALTLNPALTVDLTEFLSEAETARSSLSTDGRLAIAMAHSAMARYRGDLLPDDPYEDWADKPRQRARQAMISLLDICADDAADRGDLDELRRIVEHSIEVSPYDDARYLQAATVLAQDGRRGEAMALLRRARSALAEIGLSPPPTLLDLERSIESRRLRRGA